VHLANAYSVALADSDPELLSTYRNGLVFPDGKPLAWITCLRPPHLAQVRGPRFFEDVISATQGLGIRHFLLGGTETTLGALRKSLQERHPKAIICGSYSPPFREIDEPELEIQISMIREAEADIVWVGLGTPKQDFVAAALANRSPVVAVAIGAAFDFSAGVKREAPDWMIRAGFEWLFRMLTEPSRLWRRYTIGSLRFVIAVLRRRHEV
jgi:N-acetylglucosaminyldiphosphoundecaprenol N-acetyl-beta-D-mannosaminyltransferase